MKVKKTVTTVRSTPLKGGGWEDYEREVVTTEEETDDTSFPVQTPYGTYPAPMLPGTVWCSGTP